MVQEEPISFIFIFAAIAVYHTILKLIAIPYQLALLDGLRAARAPQARAAPQSPWSFFMPAFRRRLRLWKWIWPIVAIGVYLFLLLKSMDQLPTSFEFEGVVFQSDSLHFHLINAAMIFAFISLPWWIVAAGPLFWAPRCETFRTLFIDTLIVEVFAVLLLFYLPGLLTWDWEFEMAPIFAMMAYHVLFASVFLFVLWRVRRLGPRWFRFKD